MDGCFFEKRFQMFLSVAKISVGLRSLNNLGAGFAFTLLIRRSTTPVNLLSSTVHKTMLKLFFS